MVEIIEKIVYNKFNIFFRKGAITMYNEIMDTIALVASADTEGGEGIMQ